MDGEEMEQSSFELLEEFLNPIDQCTTFPSSWSDGCYFPDSWSVGTFVEATNTSVLDLILPEDSTSAACPLKEFYNPLVDYSLFTPFDSSFAKIETLLIDPCEGFRQNTEENRGELVCDSANEVHHIVEDHGVEIENRCYIDVPKTSHGVASMAGVTGAEKNMRTCKRGVGTPCKNLMAERRRRKRLNDRLSMLRSIVPKISKMDRTSIVADTIEYMKELLDRVRMLRGEGIGEDGDLINLQETTLVKELKPNVVPIRNPPMFDVERRETDTRIQISCAPRPGLLLSTVSSMESIGLEIQQCVISCYSDFSLRASCFEAVEHRTSSSPEDIMRTLIQNAGYGGRCL